MPRRDLKRLSTLDEKNLAEIDKKSKSELDVFSFHHNNIDLSARNLLAPPGKRQKGHRRISSQNFKEEASSSQKLSSQDEDEVNQQPEKVNDKNTCEKAKASQTETSDQVNPPFSESKIGTVQVLKESGDGRGGAAGDLGKKAGKKMVRDNITSPQTHGTNESKGDFDSFSIHKVAKPPSNSNEKLSNDNDEMTVVDNNNLFPKARSSDLSTKLS